jgi:hypothetical protein
MESVVPKHKNRKTTIMVLFEAAPGCLPLSGQLVHEPKGEMRWEKKAARKIKTRQTSKKRSSSKRKRNNRKPNYPPRNPPDGKFAG